MKEKKNLTEFMLSLVQTLEDEHRFGSAHVYRSTLHTFTAYWNKRKGRKILMAVRNVFTVSVLREFEEYLRGKLLKMNTISTYMRMLRAVYHRLLKDGEVDYTAGLFDSVYTGTCADVKRALSPADMAKILSFPLPDLGNVAVGTSVSSSLVQDNLQEARCWFSLLFLLRGISFADLARLRKCDYKDGVVSYCRQKTGRRLTVTVPKEAESLIRTCSDTNPASPYLLSILDGGKAGGIGSREEYDRYLCVLRDFNRRLDHLAYVIGIKCKLSSYTPRHTWATLAYRKKCPIGVISNALGHSSIKVTETYLKPFETEELDKANRMVIACVKDGLRNGIR